MNVNAEIKNLCGQIVEKFNPVKVILFGSYAYGKPRAGSDVDLLVVMPFEGRESQQAIKIRQKISSPLPFDLLVKTPEQIRSRIALNDFFVREITEKGRILYETVNKGMD